jgi:hypothetical protein
MRSPAALRQLIRKRGPGGRRPRPWIDESIPGWMTRSELALIAGVAADLPDHSVIVEIGSFAGRSSAHWAQNSRPTVVIFCIDPFDVVVDDFSFEHIQGDPSGVRGRASGELFAENMRTWAQRVTAVSETSPPSTWSRSADVIFVDGDHTCDGVSRDLEFWIDHLKPGGPPVGSRLGRCPRARSGPGLRREPSMHCVRPSEHERLGAHGG